MQHEAVVAQSVHLLSQMIATPSLSREEAKVASLLEGHLSSLAPQTLNRIGNNLIATWSGPIPGPTLLLCSHIDTLPPHRGWSKHPYKPTVQDDRVYGLGAANAGAAVVSMIGAVKASLPLTSGTLILCLAAEKELGANGFRAIEPQLPRYDGAIFGEPTGMAVASEMRGRVQITMHSRSHSSMTANRVNSRNAIEVLTEELAKIRGLDLCDSSRWGGAAIEPTSIQGGSGAAQIPDLITTTLNIRTTTAKPNEWVLARIRELGIEFYVQGDRRKPMVSDPHHPLIRTLQESCPNIRDYTFDDSCDASFATAPSIIIGPGKPERSHVSDEFCTYAEIHEGITVYGGTIKVFLRHTAARDSRPAEPPIELNESRRKRLYGPQEIENHPSLSAA